MINCGRGQVDNSSSGVSASVSEATGTCLREEKARALATEAGFGHFRRIDFPNNPFNLFYEIRA